MADQPNMIVFVADDHRFDALGVSGDPVVQTPNLDELARYGVRFERTYTMGGNSPAVCVPTRASLLTGVNVFRAHLGARAQERPGLAIAPDLPLLPEVLRLRGYNTHVVGKWHNDTGSLIRSFADGSRLYLEGFSDQRKVTVFEWDPSGKYFDRNACVLNESSSEVFADAAVRFVENCQQATPFFLYVAFTAPHDPRNAPSPYAEMYNPEKIPLPPNFAPEHAFDNGDLHVRDEELAPFPRTPAIIQRHMADYYAMITHLDAQIGRVLAAVRKRGTWRNTIIVYTSDHGLAVGRHGLLGKQNLYEHSVRVPLILSGPGLPEGRVVDSLVCAFDLYPTLCALADVPVPRTVEARSLLPLVGGEVRGVHDSTWAMYRDVQRMVTDGRWKLIRYYRSHRRAAGTQRIQLFDLSTDPWEMHDLAKDAACRSRLSELVQRLQHWQENLGDPLASERVLPEIP